VEALDADAARLRLTSAALAPSAKSRKQSSCSISGEVLEVEGAELEVEHQHPRPLVAADDVMGELQAR
jgi:hypothetical protein